MELSVLLNWGLKSWVKNCTCVVKSDPPGSELLLASSWLCAVTRWTCLTSVALSVRWIELSLPPRSYCKDWRQEACWVFGVMCARGEHSVSAPTGIWRHIELILVKKSTFPSLRSLFWWIFLWLCLEVEENSGYRAENQEWSGHSGGISFSVV